MRLIQEARSLASTQVILAMVVSVLASASLFGVLMYITPILENVTRLSADSVTLMLFLLGGRLGDWSLTP
jgi:DHA1 family inner membrane transport protein